MGYFGIFFVVYSNNSFVNWFCTQNLTFITTQNNFLDVILRLYYTYCVL